MSAEASAETAMPPRRMPFLVYRDRIGAASEIAFLRRQYIGFTRLEPTWIGRILLPQAGQISERLLRLGGAGPSGGLHRLLFRHFGAVPPLDLPPLAPVLHAQFARGGALALPLARSLRARLVVTLHGGDVGKEKNWHGTALARRWPAVVKYAGAMVCVSSAVAEIAIRRGVPQGKLVVLPIGVEVPAQMPPSPPPSYHLFVGRFVEKKGIAVLAGAIRQLRAAGDGTRVICVGDGELRPVLEAVARDVAGVQLTGWLPQSGVQALMAGAWSVVVPSVVAPDGDTEGLPSVVPEAMAQGCPVIGSAEGGIAEAVRDGATGLLIAPRDAAALAAAMARVTNQPELRNGLARAAFADAARRFNARVQSAALEALLLKFC
jgi:colanic acid/amylovoran biosynthesis glycosyltransferase